MLNIALTGGIGSGKTLVSRVFHLLGVPIYYSDSQAKKLYDDPAIKSKVISLLGNDAYQGSTLNKAYVSNLIFNDNSLLQHLNSIIHPAVRTHYSDWVKRQQSPFVIQESALIFESQLQENFDKVILVTAPIDIRLSRVLIRDKSTEERIKKRMESQLLDKDKINLADYIITNDGVSKILPQIISIYHKLQSLDTSLD